MNKALTSAIILLFIGVFLHPANLKSGNHHPANITVADLAKKWKLDKYSFSFFSEVPSEKEKHDYLHLSRDMTYTSLSEGEFDEGAWRLNAAQQRIYLSSHAESGELALIIEELSAKHLILIIDDPSDPDTKYLNIHFKN